ncbi:hypothetical protein FCOIX_12012 [Fusarium coicis]|nr:hypothetical protein FCOIX_12012 [Fusarium coicis]
MYRPPASQSQSKRTSGFSVQSLSQKHEEHPVATFNREKLNTVSYLVAFRIWRQDCRDFLDTSSFMLSAEFNTSRHYRSHQPNFDSKP